MAHAIDMSDQYGDDRRAARELLLFTESTQDLYTTAETIKREGLQLLSCGVDAVAVRSILARRYRRFLVTSAIRRYRREVVEGAYFRPEVIRHAGDALAADALGDDELEAIR